MRFFEKIKLIYPIIIIGLGLRIVCFFINPSFLDHDGYQSFGRVLYEYKVFGRDKQFFIKNGVSDINISQYFNNPKNPKKNINNKEIILTASHPIGWPLQIAILYSIFGININVLLLYNLFLSVISVYVFYLIALKLFNVKIANIVAIIAALNPIFITDCVTTLTEPGFLFFQLLAIYFLIQGINKNRKRDFLFFGALIGFTCLIRPVAILFPFAILFFLIIFKRFQLRFLLSFITLSIILSPWIIRNYIVFNKFIPLTNLSGIVFLQGNNQYVYNERSGSWISQDIFYKIEKIEIIDKTELEVKELSSDLGKKYLKNLNFTDIVKLEWYKIRYGFGLSYKCLAGKNQILHFSIKDKIVYFPLVLLSILCISFKRQPAYMHFLKNKIFIVIFLAAFSIYLFQTLVFFGYSRYREYLFDPYLIIMASLGIFFISNQFYNFFKIKIN